MIKHFTALEIKIWSQDVTKAYIQEHELTRAVYVKRTKDFQIPPDQHLIFLKPLYVITESGDYWLRTNKKYLTQTLNIEPTDG